jgi:mRNA-degrading endonuclease RelE of RelBE toxin-antitoxin system
MKTVPIVVVYLEDFLREAEGLWSDEELQEFTDFIARNPEAGTVVPGMHGVRKVRWSREGTGKRGGVRVIYYFYNETLPIFLMDIYAKSAKGDLDTEGKRAALKFVAAIRAKLKERKS